MCKIVGIDIWDLYFMEECFLREIDWNISYDNNKFIGHVFAGKYLDCGSMSGYINSSIELSKI